MIKVPTTLYGGDNSGAVLMRCIQISKFDKRRGAVVGSLIRAVVRQNLFKRHVKKKSRIISKRQKLTSLIISTRSKTRRLGNWWLWAGQNLCVPLNNTFTGIYASRIFGPSFYEIRFGTKHRKVLFMSDLVY